MRSIFPFSLVVACALAPMAHAQQGNEAVSEGLARLLGRAQQGTETSPGGTTSAPTLGGNLVDATSPQVIVGLMQQAGYRAVLGVDNVGDPKIDSSAAGVNFSIYFYGCDNGNNCQSLQFSQGFDMEKGTSFQLMNDWNATQRFGFAYLDSESDPFVSMDVNMSYGVATENLMDTFALWDQVLSDFQAHIGW